MSNFEEKTKLYRKKIKGGLELNPDLFNKNFVPF